MALKKAAVTQTETNQPEAKASDAVVDTQANEQVTEQVLETREEQAADVQASNEQAQEGAESADIEHEVQPEQAAQVEQGAQAEQGDEGVVAEQAAGGKEVALKSEGGEVAVAGKPDVVRGAMAAYTQDMAELGFEGLTVDGMSFDRIKLTEGKFVLGSEEVDLGTEIKIQLMSTRPIFIVRQRDDDDAEIYFSYDAKGEFLTDGSSSAEIREKWLEDGYGTEDAPLDIKRYIEGMAMLINRDDEWSGHMVSLSIPPASTSRLGGACMTGKQRFGRDPSGLEITCKVGQKIQKGSISWRPWVFVATGKFDG